MAFAKESEDLEKAFNGMGVNEAKLVSVFGKLKKEDMDAFFGDQEITSENVLKLKTIANYNQEKMEACFLQFHNAMAMWTKHPFERDASIMKSAVEGQGDLKLLVEVLCTRTCVELVGAKMAYQTMYATTIEEEIQALIPQTMDHKVLMWLCGVPLRGNTIDIQDIRRNGNIFKVLRSDCVNLKINPAKEKFIVNTLLANQSVECIENSIRSHLEKQRERELELEREREREREREFSFEDVKTNEREREHEREREFSFEDVKTNELYVVASECRRDPVAYFVKVIEDAFAANDGDTITRVIVSREDIDLDKIDEAFNKKTKMRLCAKIQETCRGNFQNFLLGLVPSPAKDWSVEF